MRYALILIAIIFVAACAAQPPETSTGTDKSSDKTASATPAATQPADPAQPAVASGTSPMERAGTSAGANAANPDPANPDRACKTDTDCAVKDVGNCCGAYPMCVGKNAHTDPAAVQAQCAKDGMASICGFREVRGCTCVQGQCQDVTDGEVVM